MKAFNCTLQNYIGITFIYIINNLVFKILFINRILNADVMVRKKHFIQNIDRQSVFVINATSLNIFFLTIEVKTWLNLNVIEKAYITSARY